VLFSVAPTRVAENTAATGSAAATAILGARADAQTDGPIAKATTRKKATAVKKAQDNQKKATEEGASPANITQENQAYREGCG
jgi:hypothetical protein